MTEVVSVVSQSGIDVRLGFWDRWFVFVLRRIAVVEIWIVWDGWFAKFLSFSILV